MYNLIGIREEIVDDSPYTGFEFETKREIVATFDKKEVAEKYVETAKLSTYQKNASWRHFDKQFKKKKSIKWLYRLQNRRSH